MFIVMFYVIENQWTTTQRFPNFFRIIIYMKITYRLSINHTHAYITIAGSCISFSPTRTI